MRKSNLSLITAGIALVLAVIWLSMNIADRGFAWVVITLVWLVTAAIQRVRHGHDPEQPYAGRRLLRRFSRLLLFWC